MATPQGEQPISSVRVGQWVEGYDPTTGTKSMQTVQHVFIDHDTDLLNVTLQTVQTAQPTALQQADGSSAINAAARRHHGRSQQQRTTSTHDEVVHTTASHPWLTADHGWARAGTLRVGERVVTANGGTAIVVGLRVVAGAADMWDLTVSHVHTFVVGVGAYVVHNCANPGGNPPGTTIVGTPNGYNVPVPDTWPSHVANNGQGIVFQEPGAAGNANMVRIMDPTPRYPQGYVRYYNSSGQPLDILGKPGPPQATHISLDLLGGAPGYYNWLAGFP